MRRRVTKIVLKEAARGLLPDAVVDQQKVGFFNAAMSQWIVSRGRQELEARFLETDPASAELFDRQELSRLVREDGRGEGAHSRLQIAILMLELWLSTVLPRARAAGSQLAQDECSFLSYAVVTPARNEATNLPRLAACLVEQTVQPSAWVIVDDGSTDGTAELAQRLADEHSWMEVVAIEGDPTPARGGPIVRAFTAGLEHVDPSTDVVAKLDADLSFAPDHWELLLAEFAADESLGIAGGTCWEEQAGVWKPQFTTRNHVRGAEKAYRRSCLDVVLPFEQRMGWDGSTSEGGGERVANEELPSPGGTPSPTPGRARRSAREVARPREMAHFMGYRPSYLLFRALYRGMRDPVALSMIWGYARAAIRRRPRWRIPRFGRCYVKSRASASCSFACERRSGASSRRDSRLPQKAERITALRNASVCCLGYGSRRRPPLKSALNLFLLLCVSLLGGQSALATPTRRGRCSRTLKRQGLKQRRGGRRLVRRCKAAGPAPPIPPVPHSLGDSPPPCRCLPLRLRRRDPTAVLQAGAPCKSFGRAYQVASPGETISVAGGVYRVRGPRRAHTRS